MCAAEIQTLERQLHKITCFASTKVQILTPEELQTLDRQTAHRQHLHELKVEDVKARLFRSHKQIREKELENNKLTESVLLVLKYKY